MFFPGVLGLLVSLLLTGHQAVRAAAAPAPAEQPTRILLEMSRGFMGNGPSALRAAVRADGQRRYAISRNFGPLRAEVLDPFDVVIVGIQDGRMVQPPPGGWPPSILNLGYAAPYEPEEIAAVGRYVRSGGALIAMGCGPRWASACQRSMQQTGQAPWPIARMPLNQLCSPLGIFFTDRSAKRPPEPWSAADQRSNPLWAGANSIAVALAQDRGGVLTAPAGARVLLAAPNGAPTAVAVKVGQGTVVAISLQTIVQSFRYDDTLTGIRELVDLAVAGSRPQGSKPAPETLYMPGSIAETKTCVILALPCMAERAREVASVAEHAEAFIPRFLGLKDLFELVPARRQEEKLRILVRVSGPAGSAGQNVQVGGYSNNQHVPVHHEITHIIWPNRVHPFWFGEAFAGHVGRRGRADLGLVEGAAQILERKRAELAAYERERGMVDLAKCPDRPDPSADLAWYSNKATIVFADLERRHGDDFFKRYVVALRRHLSGRPDRTRRMTLREQIGLFSETAGADLAPWFRSIGTTVD